MRKGNMGNEKDEEGRTEDVGTNGKDGEYAKEEKGEEEGVDETKRVSLKCCGYRNKQEKNDGDENEKGGRGVGEEEMVGT